MPTRNRNEIPGDLYVSGTIHAAGINSADTSKVITRVASTEESVRQVELGLSDVEAEAALKSRTYFGDDDPPTMAANNGDLYINTTSRKEWVRVAGAWVQTSSTSVTTIAVYKQVSPAPSAPSGGSYNFSTGVFTPPSGWSAAMPASSPTVPTYVSACTFRTLTPEVTVSADSWSSPVTVAQNGADGADGADGAAGEGVLTWALTNITRSNSNQDFARTSSGSAGWNSYAFTQELFGQATIGFKPARTTAALMVGLDGGGMPHVAADTYAKGYYWFLDSSGACRPYALGAAVGPSGLTYAVTDRFQVAFDGLSFRFLRNGSVLHTVDATTYLRVRPGILLYSADTSVSVSELAFSPAAMGWRPTWNDTDINGFPSGALNISDTDTPGAAGLYLGPTKMGYYNSGWKTYMDNAGNFYLSGTGANGLSWNGTTLSINGNITMSAGSVIDPAATVSSVAMSTISGNATNGATAYTGTANFRNTTQVPNGTTPTLTTPTRTQNADGSVDITLSWTYTNGTYPSEHWLILYASGATVTDATSTPRIMVDGALRTIILRGWPAGTWSFGIKAGRQTSAGPLYATMVTTNWLNFSATGALSMNTSGSAASATTAGTSGRVVANAAAAPAGAGLFVGNDYMGYYSSSVWRSYIDSNGNFKLFDPTSAKGLTFTASTGALLVGKLAKDGPYLEYNGTDLTVRGSFKLSGSTSYLENSTGNIRLCGDNSGAAYGEGLVFVSNARAFADATAQVGDNRWVFQKYSTGDWYSRLQYCSVAGAFDANKYVFTRHTIDSGSAMWLESAQLSSTRNAGMASSTADATNSTSYMQATWASGEYAQVTCRADATNCMVEFLATDGTNLITHQDFNYTASATVNCQPSAIVVGSALFVNVKAKASNTTARAINLLLPAGGTYRVMVGASTSGDTTYPDAMLSGKPGSYAGGATIATISVKSTDYGTIFALIKRAS